MRATLDGKVAEGFIRAVHVRFWHTDEFRRYVYEVRFAKKYWGCYVYSFEADKLELLNV